MLSPVERLGRALAAFKKGPSGPPLSQDRAEAPDSDAQSVDSGEAGGPSRSPNEPSVRIEWDHPQGGIGSQVAVVDHRAHWGLTVTSPTRLPNRQSVRISDNGAHYHAEVAGAFAVDDQFEVHLAFLDGGRRRENRIVAGGRVQVELLSRNGGSDLDAEVVNVSPDGLQLTSIDRIAVGQTIRVVGAETVMLCRVRHSSDCGGQYRCGVQFLGGQP